jgi:hypothetical protein
MKKEKAMIDHIPLVAVALGVLWAGGAVLAEKAPSAGALEGDRPRVIVSTDIGGSDPDDFQSMVHYLMYADVLETEGLISSPPKGGRARDIHEVIDAYEKDYPRLKARSKNFPAPKSLRPLVKQGALKPAPAQGFSKPTAGSRWIIERAKAKDPKDRPLWILVWGSITDVAQAVHDDPSIKPAIRVYFISSWNRRQDPHARDYLYEHHKDLWWIECDTTFRGMYMGGAPEATGGDMSNRRFIPVHGRDHGALGDLLHAKMARLKMGDTPSVLYLLRGDPDDPSGPHWGGRFHRPDPNRPDYWTDLPAPELVERGKPGARTVNRWRGQYLNHWKNRLDWLKR